jgi:hypothetical protein
VETRKQKIKKLKRFEFKTVCLDPHYRVLKRNKGNKKDSG